MYVIFLGSRNKYFELDGGNLAMKIFRESDNTYDVVDSVVEHGVAVLAGTTTIAERHGSAIIARLKPYEDVAPHLSHEDVPNSGGLYYVYDCNRFSCGDERLKALVERVDSSIG